MFTPVAMPAGPTQVFGKVQDIIKAGGGTKAIMAETGLTRARAIKLRDRVCQLSGMTPNWDCLRPADKAVLDAKIAQLSMEGVKKISELKKAMGRSEFSWMPIDPWSPLGIAFMADIHGGSTGVEYDAFERDVQLVLNTPGLYVVLAGDMIDNMIKHLASVLANNMPAALQWMWLAELLVRLAPKLLAIVGGNHEAWTAAFSNFEPLKQFASRLAVPYDADEVLLKIGLQDAVYDVAVRHKYRFNSSDNPSHSVKKLWTFGDYDFDVGVVGDKHVATVEPFVRHQHTKWVLRPGSYQVYSKFGSSMGFHGALPVTPVAIFLPDRKDLHGFSNMEWGVRTLNGLRKEYARLEPGRRNGRKKPIAAKRKAQ